MTESNKSRRKYLAAPMVDKAVDSDGNVIPRYRFTSDNMDEGGDVITREATEEAIEKWRQWRNIRLQHDPSRPVGKAIRIGEEDGLEWNEMDVRVDDPTVKPLVDGEDPVLSAASVGIIVNEFEVNEDEEAQARSGIWDPWIITDYDLVEISLVDHPQNYDAIRVPDQEEGRGRGTLLMYRRDVEAAKKASGNLDLSLASREREWDASAADERVRAWAGGPDKEDIDWGKYRDAFFWYDENDPENFTSYKLPFADVVDGELLAVPRGVFAAAQRLDQTDIPEGDVSDVRDNIAHYYNKMSDEFDEGGDCV